MLLQGEGSVGNPKHDKVSGRVGCAAIYQASTHSGDGCLSDIA